jgi:hypothetical protein
MLPRISSYAKRVLMVRPTSFFYNSQTSTDNKFMNTTAKDREETTQDAIREFKQLKNALLDCGVGVLEYA